VTLTPHHFLEPWSRKVGAISLLPLWAVRPAQSFSACTRVNFTLNFYYSESLKMIVLLNKTCKNIKTGMIVVF
jgi:hypothetical protein